MSLMPPKITPLPEYLPADVANRLAGQEFKLGKLPESVRRRMRTPEKIRVSEHAAKYRPVTDGPHQGKWRHDYAPHTVKIMDTYGQPYVREIWYCAAEQSGKTATMLSCMHWAIDCDPGDIFYLMPDEKSMHKVTGKKIKPMLQQSKRLAKYITGRQDDLSLTELTLNHGVTIRPAWANSPATMATFPAKHCYGDEIDKGTELSGREADRVTLIRKRLRLAKGGGKGFFASTPAQLFIYKYTMSCAQVWEWQERCPDAECGLLSSFSAERLVIPEGATAEDVSDGLVKVGYACPHCGRVWDEAAREQAIRGGRWVAIKGGELLRPRRVGFHHRAFNCLDVPLSEIAAAYVKAQTGTVADKIAWANGYEVVDYKHEQVDRAEDYILRLKDEALPNGIVPRDTQLLLVLADTQRVGFYYEVMAYGWGTSLPMHVVEHGFVKRFSDLEVKRQKVWHDADGKEYRAYAGFIDSGGGTDPNRPKHTRTVQVYTFCKAHRFWKPLKGRRTMETSWNVKRLDYYPDSMGKKVPIVGGLNLYTINVTMHKNELASKLQIEPGDPGAFTLHAEITSDYAKQMCAEYQDERGYWICPKGRDNHHWDIGVYAIAAADILSLRERRKKPSKAAAPKVYSKGVQL